MYRTTSCLLSSSTLLLALSSYSWGAWPLTDLPHPGGDDSMVGNTILTGEDGLCQTEKDPVDTNSIQEIPFNRDHPRGKPDTVGIESGADNSLETQIPVDANGQPLVDDQLVTDPNGKQYITTGADGVCNIEAAPSDFQRIRKDRGEANTVCIRAGSDGILVPYQ